MTHLLETIKADLLIQIEVGEGEYIGHCSALDLAVAGQSPALVIEEIKKILSSRERLSRDEILAKRIKPPTNIINNNYEPQTTTTTIDRPAAVHGKRGRPRTKGVGTK